MFFSEDERFSKSTVVIHNSHVVYKGKKVDYGHLGPGSYHDTSKSDKRLVHQTIHQLLVVNTHIRFVSMHF